jgi:hypothetical protein
MPGQVPRLLQPPSTEGLPPLNLPPRTTPPSALSLEGIMDLLFGGASGLTGLPLQHDAPNPVMNALGELGGTMLGMGVGRRFGKPGARIPEGQQSFSEGALKVPRFRNENGTFIKHQGKWWRLAPFQAEDKTATLEWLGQGDEFTGDVLRSKKVPMDKLVENAQSQNAANSAGKVARRKK